MNLTKQNKTELTENGFTILDAVYSEQEIAQVLEAIAQADQEKDTFRKSGELFAIRHVLKEIPKLKNLLWNDKLQKVIQQLLGDNYFVIKSIYFDKPETSNWYVPYHQDLTISVDKKVELDHFGPWTSKHGQFSVQPPIDILENIYTIRIHLDDTDENNGALRVIPTSHLKRIYRPETIDWKTETETICAVNKGGIMLMKPLLLHSSKRTTNHQKRRVIHIEFSNQALPTALKWAERLN